jgi:hypothetical protein
MLSRVGYVCRIIFVPRLRTVNRRVIRMSQQRSCFANTSKAGQKGFAHFRGRKRKGKNGRVSLAAAISRYWANSPLDKLSTNSYYSIDPQVTTLPDLICTKRVKPGVPPSAGFFYFQPSDGILHVWSMQTMAIPGSVLLLPLLRHLESAKLKKIGRFDFCRNIFYY